MFNDLHTKNFFKEISEHTGSFDDVFIVLVTHFVQDREYFINSLSEVSEIGLIIPKPKSIDPKIYESISSNYNVLKITREEINNDCTDIVNLIEMKSENKNIVILDIGGYFSGVISDLVGRFGSRFIGVIEDTENGYQKYLKSTDISKINLYSVARSPLKIPEDFLVGLSICFSAEAVMREINEIYVGRTVLVLGYGKIGASIAHHLAYRNTTVYIYDIDPLKLVEAKSHGFSVIKRKESLKKADIIFCATGQISLFNSDIYHFKDNSIIFTATSSDDEINIENNISMYNKVERLSDHVVSMTTTKGNTYLLCNSGNAVNFLHGASVGKFIFLVQSEIIFIIKRIIAKTELGEIQPDVDDQKKLAEIWLKHFSLDP